MIWCIVAESVSAQTWSRGHQTFVVVLIALGLLAVSMTWWAIRRRKQSWQSFARRVGARFEVVEGRPCVSGTYRGRRFTLTISPDSSDTGLLGVEVTILRVEYSPPATGTWQVSSQTAAVTALETASGQSTVATMDEQFDAQAAVFAAPSDEVNEFLDPRRRRVILDLINRNAPCQIRLTPTEIQAIDRTINQPARTLEKRLNSMASAAQSLEDH